MDAVMRQKSNCAIIRILRDSVRGLENVRVHKSNKRNHEESSKSSKSTVTRKGGLNIFGNRNLEYPCSLGI